MNDIEKLREELYRTLETGSRSEILKASQKLDKIILLHMKNLVGQNKKPA